MSTPLLLTVGEASREVGVAPSTLRYYDRIGLVPVARSDNGRRLYDRAALRRLRLVGVCQSAGFTLEETSDLLDGSAAPGSWRLLAQRKLAELTERLERLESARRMVEEALSCDCSRVEECGRLTHRLPDPGQP